MCAHVVRDRRWLSFPRKRESNFLFYPFVLSLSKDTQQWPSGIRPRFETRMVRVADPRQVTLFDSVQRE
jgi:hypothetical protein